MADYTQLCITCITRRVERLNGAVWLRRRDGHAEGNRAVVGAAATGDAHRRPF